MPRVANGTQGSVYLAARNLCCSLLRRYLGRPICVSLCSAPTLRGRETDGQPQTIENEIPRMRKEVTLKQPQRGASLGSCQGINVSLPHATVPTRSPSNCSGALWTGELMSPHSSSSQSAHQEVFIKATSGRTRISAPLRPRVGAQSWVINSSHCD